MKSCLSYIEKQSKEAILPLLPFAPITIVIPCYNEPNISHTLNSIGENKDYEEQLHIIVVLNHSESSPKHAILQNKKTLRELEEWKKKQETTRISLSVIQTVFPKDNGGVGDARKIGMDEAIRQYLYYKKEGIIASLDADTLCAPNYLSEILNHFRTYDETNTLIINYHHSLENLGIEHYNAILQYELYLRYMVLAYRYLCHPDAFHTIGSAFAVRASAYCKQGGMNHRQAGEDFYFIQKMLRLGKCYELNNTCVYPSSRTSERVPFGTGKAVQQLIDSSQELQTYSFKAFEELKAFFDLHLSLFRITKEDYNKIVYNDLGGLIKSWLIEDEFYSKLEKINANCASEKSFSKKFFESFSIFQIIKYLNFCHEHFLQKIGIFHAISSLPEKFDCTSPENLLTNMRAILTQESFHKN